MGSNDKYLVGIKIFTNQHKKIPPRVGPGRHQKQAQTKQSETQTTKVIEPCDPTIRQTCKYVVAIGRANKLRMSYISVTLGVALVIHISISDNFPAATKAPFS